MEYSSANIDYPDLPDQGNNELQNPEMFINVPPNDTNFCDVINYSTNIPGFNNIIPNPIQSIPLKHEPTLNIRSHLLEIINRNEDSVFIDNENFKDKDIDEILEKIEKKIPKIMELQNELDILYKEYLNQYESCSKDVRTIEQSMKFLKDIEGNYDKCEEAKTIIDSMNKYTASMLKNEKLTDAKEKYIKKRKELNSCIYFVQKLNQWNTSNMCSMCFTERVDVFCNPCGHTGCRKCFEKNRNHSNVNNLNNNNKCPFCREYIIDLKSLYFI